VGRQVLAHYQLAITWRERCHFATPGGDWPWTAIRRNVRC
jgi:hypothetical protein